MKRDRIAKAKVPDVAARRAMIEGEPLPRNIAELVQSAAEDGGERCLWNFFEAGEQITYAEMGRRVMALAAGFRRIGMGKGTHVAVMLPNIPAMPLAWLAIGVLGAVMIPVNVGYRERELIYVLKDGDAEFIVTHAATLDLVKGALVRGEIAIPADRIVVAGEGDAAYPAFDALLSTSTEGFAPPSDVGHDDLLNIQYTSGTTGFPKGCMLTQRYWLGAGKVTAFRDGRTYARILAATPFFYMDPQWQLLMTIYQRATLYVAERQSASRFMSWVRQFKIEFCLLPPITLKQPVHEADADNHIIRANVYGVSATAHRALEERFDLCAREAFGMTEIGPTMYMPIEAQDMVGSGSCGIPGPFRECKVVDSEGRDVPPGVVGELVVRGAGILRGYYKKPEATATAFYGDWFRTGDLFRMDERGYFYIIGRAKDSIRRSGENIAAREVEAVLQAFPAVLEAAAIPEKDDIRGEEVKACIIWQEGTAANEELLGELIAHCRKELAAFKVPRFYEFPRELPKTSSGKIAKHKLVETSAARTDRCFDRVANAWIQ